MVVSKEITRLEHSALKLTVTISKDDVRSEYDALIGNYAKNVQIPGFRKGKVPREVIERKFGEGLKSEASGRMMEKALQQLFETEEFAGENRPLPYSTPQLSEEPVLDLSKELTFSVTYDIMPAVKVGEWKGVEIEAPVCSVEDEDLKRELDAIRERNAVVLDKDEKAKTAKGDVVTVNYCELGADGSVVAGTERQDYVFTVGSKMNVFKFDDEIVGMKKGETRDFDKTWGADEEDTELAGKTKKLRVTVSLIKEKKLPELDDELAQDVSEKYKTLADLKADLKANLEKTLESKLRELKVNALLEKVLETSTMDVPESMVRIELESRWRGLARRFNVDSDQLMKILSASGKDYDGLLTEWRPEAEKALKARLIVETLMKDMKLEASDEELDKELESMAAGMGAPLEEVKKHYAQDNMKDYLREDVKEKKLFDLLLADAKVKKGKKAKYLDLVANNG